MKNRVNYIPYRKHFALLVELGVPIVIGQLGMIVLGFADTMMVGHHSAAELSAAGFVNNLFTLCIVAGLGFSYGLTPLVGALFGRGEAEEAGCFLKNSLVMNLLVGLLMTGLMGVLFLNLDRLGQPVELLPLIRPYYLVIGASIPFVMLFNAFKQFADGITETKTAMWILLSGNSLNILGNYLLIYGHGGFPEMGLLGGGLATLVARVAMVLAFAVLFLRMKRFARYRKGFARKGLQRRSLRELNRLGWPIALQMGMETASFNVTAVMMGWLGAAALAAHQIMCTVSTLCFMLYYGIGAAVAIRVSHFHGQGDTANVRRAALAGFYLILIIGVVSCGSIVLCRNSLCGWFTESEEVNTMLMSLILPFVLYQVGDGMQSNFANALRGIAHVKPMMFGAFMAYIVVSIPASYLFAFPLGMGARGIWMGFPCGLTTAGVIFLVCFLRRVRNS